MMPLATTSPLCWRAAVATRRASFALRDRLLSTTKTVRACRHITTAATCRAADEPASHGAAASPTAGSTAGRVNMCGVQLLDKHLWQQLFQEPLSRTVRVDRAGQAELLPEVRRRVEEHLSKHELWGKPVGSVVHTPEFKLPPMLGQDVEQHFHNIAHRQACVQQHLATQFAKKTLPPQPSSWEMQPGWTRYNSDGSTHRVECPGEASVVFDVEWCVQEGHFPTLAIAASEEAWYGWVSERLCKATEGEDPAAAAGQRGLIPMEASTPGATSPRVVVGHNVGVDRARVLEEYRIYPESDIGQWRVLRVKTRSCCPFCLLPVVTEHQLSSLWLFDHG